MSKLKIIPLGEPCAVNGCLASSTVYITGPSHEDWGRERDAHPFWPVYNYRDRGEGVFSCGAHIVWFVRIFDGPDLSPVG